MIRELLEHDISEGFRSILITLYGDRIDKDPDLKDTPGRYARSILELLKGSRDTKDQIQEVMSKKFPAKGYDEMIVVDQIEVIGVCPHHFLPIEYDVKIGYIPDQKKGNCLGLSKLARMSELLAARAIKQEKLTVDIVDTLVKHLKPAGAGVVVVGSHGCMTCRGVKQKRSLTTTTKFYGVMKEDIRSRQEFLSYKQDR